MKHFDLDREVACKCQCGLIIHDAILFDMMDRARMTANMPFQITSWVRCKTHNANSGGSATSSHLQGKAVDIRYKNRVELYKMVKALMSVGFDRIGINHAQKFIHVDISRDKISPILFTY